MKIAFPESKGHSQGGSASAARGMETGEGKGYAVVTTAQGTPADRACSGKGIM